MAWPLTKNQHQGPSSALLEAFLQGPGMLLVTSPVCKKKVAPDNA